MSAAQSNANASLHALQTSPWHGRICGALLVCNCGIVLFSQLALSVVVQTNLTPQQLEAADTCGKQSVLDSSAGGNRRLSSQAGPCDSKDIAIWRNTTGRRNDEENAVCGPQCGAKVLIGTSCFAKCITKQAGLSQSCAVCFAENAQCVAHKCLLKCLPPNELSEDCLSCGKSNCGATFSACHQMGSHGAGHTTAAPPPTRPHPEAATKFYSVGEDGELGFLDSIHKAWNNGAKMLAVLLIIASGFNPHLENILMGIAIFAPLSPQARDNVLWFVNRVGRWTFLDVFVVVVIIAGLDFSVLGGDVRVRAVVQVGIFMFAVAAIWARIQGACLEVMQDRAAHVEQDEPVKLSSTKTFLLRAAAVATFVLLALGVSAPSLRFTTSDGVSGAQIRRDYSVLQLGAQHDFSDAPHAFGPVFLAVSFYVFVVALPCLQCVALAVAPCNRTVLAVVNRVCSAASLDVAVVAIVILLAHFDDIIAATTQCWSKPGDPAVIVASGHVLWGFAFLLASALSTRILVEVAYKLHHGAAPQGDKGKVADTTTSKHEATPEDRDTFNV